MSQSLELAKSRLYGPDALSVLDVKLFPGSSRDVTSEQIADQINKALSLIAVGDFDEVAHGEDD